MTDMKDVGVWVDRACADVTADSDGFFRAINLYIHKPHVVNRRICGTRILADLTENTVETTVQKLSNFMNGKDKIFTKLLRRHIAKSDSVEFQIILQDLFPRQLEKHKALRQLVIIDKSGNCASFLPICYNHDVSGENEEVVLSNEVSYQFSLIKSLHTNRIVLRTYGDIDGATGQTSVKWLIEHLLRKVSKWSSEKELNCGNASLKLLPVDKYSALYQKLKTTYGHELVKIWPEKTDPYKFVYEDVAIATYLILLWEKEREEKQLVEKQSFVDLGCGNGLLVYILSSEGHKGLGVDVRRRKIWSMYPTHTVLKELPVTPSENNSFTEYEWFIGNHSDELTPWIPVMAARSSYKHRFFVLPCCHYDFDSKFSQRVSGESQYRTYLGFVKQVGEKCGFHVQEDTLRIPSTKRVCFIGQSRSYPEKQESQIEKTRTEYILSRCKKKQIDTMETGRTTNPEIPVKDPMESVEFKVRCKVEKVRNCSQISRDIQSVIVQKVFEAVLNAKNAERITTSTGTSWNKGGSVALGRIVLLFDKTILQQLKSECGGLQTLLRNHHHIFHVFGGEVKLRNWTAEQSKRNKRAKLDLENSQKRVKRKLCWFYQNHPDGCPDIAEQCRFAHGEDDVKSDLQMNAY